MLTEMWGPPKPCWAPRPGGTPHQGLLNLRKRQLCRESVLHLAGASSDSRRARLTIVRLSRRAIIDPRGPLLRDTVSLVLETRHSPLPAASRLQHV